MNISRKAGLVVVALLVLAFGLFAQSQELKAVPDIQKTDAQRILNLLIADDSGAVDFIFWDDFYLNDEDITYFYYDAVDYGDDYEFTLDIITEISAALHYSGDEGDYFTDWTFEKGESGDVFARCMNKRKTVDLIFYAPVEDHLYLREILITNKD